ncbi:VCBS repeat-containing protein [Paenarthrobacter sp. Z7-10]|uniref:GH25 family lysozyme n=1 Tax=Paenarthrobacter sp. Z7-10 TaxID=2787635 RepID=UPI0022A9173F|nr:GH25 family lysozyme [Paenarthrobacter sp. Z7-10]MCZ2403928.1 VCBS repeat-containing protein [Paenarthrobacter sp. Z7-10]
MSQRPSTSTPSVAERPDGTSGLPLGLDVSGWQQNVDWTSVRTNGGQFAFIKAAEGPWKLNDYFAQQYNGAAAAGLVRGAYTFARPNLSSGANQAAVLVSSGRGWSADGRTLPGVLDLEQNTLDGTGPCYGLSPAQLVQWTKDFTRTYKSLTGRDAIIYSAYYFWNSCMGGTTSFSQANPLWIAAYGASLDNLLMPGGWPVFSVWQYADSGTFPGDQNVFNGSYAQLLRFVSPTTTAVPPVATAPPASSPPPVAPPIVAPPIVIPTTSTNKVTPVGDFNADGRNDMLSVHPDGTLWFAGGNGQGGYSAERRIGTGWNIYAKIAGTGDFNGDGKNDVLAIRLDGSLWFYAGTGAVDSDNEGYRSAVQIGTSGWNQFRQVTAVRDFNGDGKNDLVATKPDGTLWFYAGTGVVSANSSGYRPAVRIGNSGWDAYSTLIGTGDFNKDGKNDLAATRPDGSLWFYAGTGRVTTASSGYKPAVKIGNSGWNGFSDVFGSGDMNGDGNADIMARRADSSLWFYAGTGMANLGYQPPRKVGNSGWTAFKQVIPTGDFNSDNRPDLVAVRPDGTLWFYAGNGDGGYRTALRIGSGWNAYANIIGARDFNSDGRNDLIAVRADGSLWFYAGTGSVSASNEGYARARKIGSGWNIYTSVIGISDFNGDGRNDLAGVRADGSLWFYAGTGRVDSSSEGYARGLKIGSSGWNSFSSISAVGDFNGDRRNDWVAARTDGSLWFYAGTGLVSARSEGYSGGKRFGDGWNTPPAVLGIGDANADGKTDLAQIKSDGSLWFYPGTNMHDDGYGPSTRSGSLS